MGLAYLVTNSLSAPLGMHPACHISGIPCCPVDTMHRRVATCCAVLQHVVLCCSMLCCFATCCTVRTHARTHAPAQPECEGPSDAWCALDVAYLCSTVTPSVASCPCARRPLRAAATMQRRGSLIRAKSAKACNVECPTAAFVGSPLWRVRRVRRGVEIAHAPPRGCRSLRTAVRALARA